MSHFENFKKSAELFEGDKALFWAGRMSMVVTRLENSTPSNFSEVMNLLSSCKTMYDDFIMKNINDSKQPSYKDRL